MGNYVVDVIGEDCIGLSCIVFVMVMMFYFIVVFGVFVGLVVILSLINILVVFINEEFDVGVVNVYVLDVVGNRLYNFDEVLYLILVIFVDVLNVL